MCQRREQNTHGFSHGSAVASGAALRGIRPSTRLETCACMTWLEGKPRLQGFGGGGGGPSIGGGGGGGDAPAAEAKKDAGNKCSMALVLQGKAPCIRSTAAWWCLQVVKSTQLVARAVLVASTGQYFLQMLLFRESILLQDFFPVHQPNLPHFMSRVIKRFPAGGEEGTLASGKFRIQRRTSRGFWV